MKHLELTYKCHSSIGNSLNLKIMLEEVLLSFVEDTNANNGFFYLIDEKDEIYSYISYSDDAEFNMNLKELLKAQTKALNTTKLIDYKDSKLIIIPINTGFFVISYKNDKKDFEHILSMFESLIVKLNISVDACLNIQKIRTKNKILNQLTNELKEQQKQLIELDKYKTNFLANMSHELKTPLNSIIVISSIMSKNKNEKLDKEQIKNMKIINNCGNDLLFLINDVLDISKIEAGELSIHLGKININRLIKELVDSMRPMITEKALFLQLSCTLNEIILLNDAQRIKQILKNLLSNAIKFTHEGKISIIAIENEDDVTIKIIDEGIGIAEDKLKYIFERFKQADGSTTRKYGGTGLGLAISKELAILLGADLKAYSLLGKGSTFELVLPKKTTIKNISDDKVTISSKDENTIIEDIVFFDMEEASEEEVEKIKEKSILLINIDHEFFFPLAIYLKKENIKIDYCKTSYEFYEKKQENYNLIILEDRKDEEEIEEFIEYSKEKDFKIGIFTKNRIKDPIYINKELSKTEIIKNILNKLEK